MYLSNFPMVAIQRRFIVQMKWQPASKTFFLSFFHSFIDIVVDCCYWMQTRKRSAFRLSSSKRKVYRVYTMDPMPFRYEQRVPQNCGQQYKSNLSTPSHALFRSALPFFALAQQSFRWEPSFAIKTKSNWRFYGRYFIRTKCKQLKMAFQVNCSSFEMNERNFLSLSLSNKIADILGQNEWTNKEAWAQKHS